MGPLTKFCGLMLIGAGIFIACTSVVWIRVMHAPARKASSCGLAEAARK
jgi:hypothetical protein